MAAESWSHLRCQSPLKGGIQLENFFAARIFLGWGFRVAQQAPAAYGLHPKQMPTSLASINTFPVHGSASLGTLSALESGKEALHVGTFRFQCCCGH